MEPFEVQMQITQGRATLITVWVEDNHSMPARLDALQGVEFSNLSMFPVPSIKGPWKLYARAMDACGNADQTGLNRIVTVK